MWVSYLRAFWIIDFMIGVQLIIEAQAGFRIYMSTVDNVFILHGLISHMFNQVKKIFCAFVDFTKA